MYPDRYTDRFAPSPTGELHLGHGFSALVGWRAAQAAGGRFLLRIEDLDQDRSRPEFVEGITRDLAWLGVEWEQPVLFQSARLPAYRTALDRLTGLGLTYACTCTRRDIAEAVTAPQEGVPASGPDGTVYPGTCRGRAHRPGETAAIRLDMRSAIAELGGAAAVAALNFQELDAGPAGEAGEVRLEPEALADGPATWCWRAATALRPITWRWWSTDAWQDVTHVTRGRDLFPATPFHRLLQALLGLATPVYRHHRLIRDAQAKRLAKRDRAHSLAQLRADGWRPTDVLHRLGLD